MNKPDWYYIYSQRYYPYHLYLQESIPDVFNKKEIFIDQAIFNEHLYKHAGEHFFSRITVKVETLVKIIKEKRMAQDKKPFFFTDVDIVIRNNAATDLLKYTKLSEFDILFQQEYLDGPTVNPGVILIWPTQASEDFWCEVLKQMSEKITMEMVVINEILDKMAARCGRFSITDVCSPITIKKENLFIFSVYHLLCGKNDRIEDLKEKLIQAKILEVDIEKYYRLSLEKYGINYM